MHELFIPVMQPAEAPIPTPTTDCRAEVSRCKIRIVNDKSVCCGLPAAWWEA